MDRLQVALADEGKEMTRVRIERERAANERAETVVPTPQIDRLDCEINLRSTRDGYIPVKLHRVDSSGYMGGGRGSTSIKIWTMLPLLSCSDSTESGPVSDELKFNGKAVNDPGGLGKMTEVSRTPFKSTSTCPGAVNPLPAS